MSIKWNLLQEHQQIVRNVREFYFGDAEIDDALIEQYVTLFSDMNFAYHMYKSAAIHAEQSNANVFFYQYEIFLFLKLPLFRGDMWWCEQKISYAFVLSVVSAWIRS